ncbi:M56 family metallopeptidase [Dyella amyloliquefaciens]|uniref:M56 family metallopeptidase n=1 Tax=Dyella amyloliquefaciens TaxID=1770545 RepID=UPI00102E67C4|nr:M56 family metallopeptidase [Dyella amyloliquefaciens]
MLPWMTYATLVAVLLSMAALIGEHAAKQRQVATRGIWLSTMLLSLLLPVMIAFASIRIPLTFHANAPATTLVLRGTTSIPMPAGMFDWVVTEQHATTAHRVNTAVGGLWLALSALLLGVFAFATASLHRQKRSWKEGHLCGTKVLFSPKIGPAVIGILQPHIVVPGWLAEAPKAQQKHVIAHESSHLRARDPQLLALVLALVVLFPWNIALWWQFHRLRRAVEVDCDARVLQSGGDLHEYCETLIEVGQYRSTTIGVAAGMSESVSFLEQRIKLMLLKPKKWARATAIGLACFSLGVAAVAAQVTPPDTNTKATDNAVTLSPDVLNKYVGYYKVSDLSAITVTRSDNHLVLRLSGQVAFKGPMDLYPRNNTQFFVPGMDATVDFIQDVQGNTKALTGSIKGHVAVNAARVNEAAVDQINKALAKRIADQKPFPGSEKALQLLLSDPDGSAGISPELARVRQEQKAGREKYLAGLGPVTSYKFGGVTDFGWDRYVVERSNGAETIYLLLDSSGLIVSAYRHPVNG